MGLLWARALGLRSGPALTAPTSLPRPTTPLPPWLLLHLRWAPTRRGMALHFHRHNAYPPCAVRRSGVARRSTHASLSPRPSPPTQRPLARPRGAALHLHLRNLGAYTGTLLFYATPSSALCGAAQRGAARRSTYSSLARPARRGAPPTRRSPALRGAALHLLVARPPCAARRSTYSTVARPRAARRFTYVSVAYTGTRPAMTPRRCSVTL
jgi:hypothetical protein